MSLRGLRPGAGKALTARKDGRYAECLKQKPEALTGQRR